MIPNSHLVKVTPKAPPPHTLGTPENQPKNIPKQALSTTNTQEHLHNDVSVKIFCKEVRTDDFYSEEVLGKSRLGVSALEGLVPVTLEGLEGRFPRDRFLTLDVETTGLSAASDGVRTVQFADGASAAMVVFDRPVAARALVVLADFLRGRRVVAHNARFRGELAAAGGY